MAEIKIFHNGNWIDVSWIYNLDSREVTLFKWSKIASTEKDSLKIIPDVQRTYYKYVETWIIKDSVLIQDCTFTSPFFAASIANLGRVNWRSFFISDEWYPLSRYIFTNYIRNNINKDDEIERKAKSEINEFNKLFPLETLWDLPIERYDYRAENWEENKAFINWIEKRTDSLWSWHLASNYNKLFYRERTKSDYDILSSLKPLLSKYNTDIRWLYKIFIKWLADFIKTFNEENYSSIEDYPCKDFLERSNVIKMKVLLLYQKPLFWITTLLNVKSLLTDLWVKFDKNNMDVIEWNILLKNELFKALPELKNKSTYVISKCLREYIHWAWKDTSWIPWWSKQEKTEENILPSTTSNLNMTNNKISLNTILYWVPWTGKTYNTVNYAVAAIEWKSFEDVASEDWDTVKDRYDTYKSDGQIIFSTFHQSFWYEDFIEWIKAKVEDNWNINYEVESWIFKNLCEVAESEENITTVSKSNVDVDNVQIFKMSLWEVWVEDWIYDYCIENDVISLWFSDIDFTPLNKNATVKEIKEYIAKNYPNEEVWFTADAIFRFKSWMNEWDLVFISKWNLYLRAIWKVTSEYYYDENSPIKYKHFRKVEWLLKDVNIPYERINTKKFSQQSIYNLKDDSNKETSLKLDEIKSLIWEKKSWEKRNYVLIIDEINRWNISKIFWELITLIEPNKRLWWKEQIKVKLPYSQKEFWVPNNLYIIWTMNTADRSIALMDLALRRRFKFREIEPNPELLNWITVAWIDIKELFITLNKRIEFLYDRDHLLGHAYFLPLKKDNSLDKLNSIMLDNIVPLLQEYFHDDWEKIQLVLWEWIVKSEMMSAKGLWINNSEYEDYPKYVINTHLSAQDYSY